MTTQESFQKERINDLFKTLTEVQIILQMTTEFATLYDGQLFKDLSKE